MERFNLKKLNEVKVKGQCRVEVSNRFAALEDLDSELDINDRRCGLVVRVLGYRRGDPGSIPGTTRFSGKKKKENT
jgi:hypothetical protein